MTPETSEKHAIRDYLRFKGWFVYHNLAGLGCFAGLTDLTAIRNGIVLQVEVKTEKGVQSQKQKDYEIEWKNQGGHYFCGNLEKLIQYIGLEIGGA